MVVRQEFAFTEDSTITLDATTEREAQIFTLGASGDNKNFLVESVDIKVKKTGAPGDITWEIQRLHDSGEDPTGQVLATGTLAAATVTGSSLFHTSAATTSLISLERGKKYALVYKGATLSGGNEYVFDIDSAGTYTGGNRQSSEDSGRTWAGPLGSAFAFSINGDSFDGTITNQDDIIIMSGENVDSTGDTLANRNLLVLEVEAYLSNLMKLDIVSKWDTLNTNLKRILSEYAARYCGMQLILFNMAGYTSRVEAEDMVNTHIARLEAIEKILKDQAVVTFMQRAT